VRRPFEGVASAEDCVRASSLVVVMTPWPEFGTIPADAFRRLGGRLTVIDCWRVIAREIAEVADVVYLGYGAVQSASVSV
jgi:hypothetical protein